MYKHFVSAPDATLSKITQKREKTNAKSEKYRAAREI